MSRQAELPQAGRPQLLDPDETAFEIVNEGGRGMAVLTCDHASNRFPRRLGSLGLGPAEIASHIAWDPGAAWVARRQTPQPGGVYDAPLHFDAARVERWPRSFIDCTEPALATIAVSRQRVRVQPGWRVLELATGHDAMVSAPQALADSLLALG